jgi:hypothetical protein
MIFYDGIAGHGSTIHEILQSAIRFPGETLEERQCLYLPA